MSITLSKTKHYLFLLAIILTNIVIMHDYVVLPVANNLYEAFPESVAGVNFIISGPSVFLFIGSLLAPVLMGKCSKKLLLSISCSVFAVASIFGSGIVSLGYIIVCRSICGLACGCVQVIVLDLIADYYVDENKRASFLGIYNAGMAGIGAVMGLVAGNLAVNGWRNAYLTYLAAIPMVLLVILFVPKMQSVAAQQQTDAAGNTAPMGKHFWIMLLNYVLINLCFSPLMMMSSVYIAENQLGNEAFSGLASSLSTLGGCLCSLVFGFLFSRLKARTSLISYCTITVGLLCMYFFPGRFIFLVICTLCGGAYGMAFSYVMSMGPSIVAPANVSKAISYLSAGCGLALFAGTYVVTAIMEFMPQHTVGAACLILGAVCGVSLALEYYNTGKMK